MTMKKFINNPDNITAELLEGLALANPKILEVTDHNLIINKGLATADRVTIVTIGGAGHEPAWKALSVKG
jgi:dihydroxyacetone kinase-like protein